MSFKLIYLSAERKSDLLKQEIKNGIKVILNQQCDWNFLSQLSITSILLKANDNANNDEDNYSVIEISHPLEENNDLGLQEEAGVIVSEDKEIHINDFYKLAEYLHSFADTHFESTRTPVHIFWCVENYIPCPSEVVEFYGVFERLCKWYSASLNVITKNLDAIEEWLTFLPIRVVNSSEEVIEDIFYTIWRGSLTFSEEGNSGFTLFSDIVIQCQDKSSDLFNLTGLKDVQQPLYMLPMAEVFSEVDLDSIPMAFIQKGSLCTLSPSPHLSEAKKVETAGILHHLSSRAGVGTLFRIRHSTKPPSLKGLEATTTQTWKQMVAEGNFNLSPGYSFEGHHEVAVFLILPTATNSDSAYCVVLQDPIDFGEDVIDLILQEQLTSPVEDESQKGKILRLLRETFSFSRIQTEALSCLLLNLPRTIAEPLKKLDPSSSATSLSNVLALEWATSNAILFHSSLQATTPVAVHLPNTTIISESCVPKECWPEFRALEEAEKGKKNSILRCTSGDFLGGLSPPVQSRKDSLMGASQLLKCYYKFCSEKSCAEALPASTGRGKSKFDWLRNKSWREALHLKHFGIYYNLGRQQEKLELMCTRLREQMVRCETASTCTLFGNHESTFLSQVERKTRKSSQLPNPLTTLRPRRNKVGKADDSSVASSLRSLSFLPKNGPTTRTASKNLKPQLRRSPRKRVKEELKPSDLLGKNASPARKKTPLVPRSQIDPKPSDLSELHKKKLRHAIVFCLEEEGVTMDDALFKVCFKKLFAVCRLFALDVVDQGGTRRSFEKIAKSHVKQVVHFEKLRKKQK